MAVIRLVCSQARRMEPPVCSYPITRYVHFACDDAGHLTNNANQSALHFERLPVMKKAEYGIYVVP